MKKTAFLFLLLVCGCSTSPRYTKPVIIFPAGYVQKGIASYYAGEFHGRKTSSGEIFDMNGLTCAHRMLPLGTIIRVVNLENGRSIVLRVNDRGPFKRGRILDVSREGARRLGFLEKGTALVSIEVLRYPEGY